jgi:hypothetical protein
MLSLTYYRNRVAQFQDSEGIFVFPTRQSLQPFQTGALARRSAWEATLFPEGGERFRKVPQPARR